MNKTGFTTPFKLTRRAWLLLVAGAMILASRCSDRMPTLSGGGGSETINAKIIVTDTVAQFQTEVKADSFSMRVFSGHYKPYERMGFADSIKNDSAGVLAWNAPFSGEFNFLLSQGGGKAAFIPNLKLKRGIIDTIHCSLSKRMAFKGRIVSGDPSPYVLFIQGTPFFCISDSASRFSMPSLPNGNYVVKTRPVKGRLFMVTNDYLVDTDSLGDKVNVTIEAP